MAEITSVFHNYTGSSRYFGFLLPHGATVANGGTFTIPGYIHSLLLEGRKYAFEDTIKNMVASNKIGFEYKVGSVVVTTEGKVS